jgi:site-specific recombinase XerD
MLTNQKVNSYLKIIAELTGINKRLSFHSSRHTFATNSLEKGVDIAAVSSLMGHRTIKTTQIYAKVTRKRKVDVIRHLNEQNIKFKQA